MKIQKGRLMMMEMMKNQMTVWSVLAVWLLMWSFVDGRRPALVLPAAAAGGDPLQLVDVAAAGHNRPTISLSVQLDVGHANPEEYAELIDILVDAFSGGRTSHGFLTTRDPVTELDRYVLVRLVGLHDEIITVVIRVTDLHVMGFHTGYNSLRSTSQRNEKRDVFFYFGNISQSEVDTILKLFFPEAESEKLPFGENYVQLGDRTKVPLGHDPLTNATIDLYTRNRKNWPTSLLIIIQMLSEAVRSPYIKQKIVENYYTKFTPDQFFVSLENNWNRLGEQVQISSANGIFVTPITIGNRVVVDNIWVAALFITIIKPYNIPKHGPSSILLQPPMLINPVVSVEEGVESAEPTARIVGPDGLCVEVPNGDYHNGAGIKLGRCKINVANQLWTFKKDGTIRSNSKCLTTYGYSPGVYVMIYECAVVAKGSNLWDVRDDGTIVSTPTAGRLVLTANSPDAVLTVDTNSRKPSQGWLPTTNRIIQHPRWVRITLGTLCLHHHVVKAGSPSSLEWVPCDVKKSQLSEEELQWGLYMQGSIRPKNTGSGDSTTYCLACEGGYCKQGAAITVNPCSYDALDQRWQFTPRGNIVNLDTGLAVTLTEPLYGRRSFTAEPLDGCRGSINRQRFVAMI